jgi:hypothetical protein
MFGALVPSALETAFFVSLLLHWLISVQNKTATNAEHLSGTKSQQHRKPNNQRPT